MLSFLIRLSDDNPTTEEEQYQPEGKKWLLYELDMIFSSRPRFSYLEGMPFVNASVLNFGIDEYIPLIDEPELRKKIVEERIKKALQRFEPRLNCVTIVIKKENKSYIIYEINALYNMSPVKIELSWDECRGVFILNG